jgi:hypothetical protein
MIRLQIRHPKTYELLHEEEIAVGQLHDECYTGGIIDIERNGDMRDVIRGVGSFIPPPSAGAPATVDAADVRA